MRRVAILTGAMLLSPFVAFFGQSAPAKTSRMNINIKDPAVVPVGQNFALESTAPTG